MIVKELKGQNEAAPFTVFLEREEKLEKDINNRFGGRRFDYSRTFPFGGNSRKIIVVKKQRYLYIFVVCFAKLL